MVLRMQAVDYEAMSISHSRLVVLVNMFLDLVEASVSKHGELRRE